MSRKICITAADGQTGRLTVELLLSNSSFSKKFAHLTLLATEPSKCHELQQIGGSKVTIHPLTKDKAKLQETLKSAECDTMFLIPPATSDKFELLREIVGIAGKLKNVQNIVLLSSAGCDVAERDKQPSIRSFIDMETLVMNMKGDPSTGSTGHSPVIIRYSFDGVINRSAGFYAENLLLYESQAKAGEISLPIGKKGKFAPVALGDVVQLACHVLTGEGEHGLDDLHRGQLIILTGPAMMAGEELAEAASQALSKKMHFKAISEYVCLR
jgi:hypothetical protein